MDKKIVKLSFSETQSVVGGLRQVNVTAMPSRQPAKQQVSHSAHYETVLARR